MGRRKSLTNRLSRNKDKERQEREQTLRCFYFNLVDATWRNRKAAKLGIPFQNEISASNECSSSMQLLPPSVFHRTLADGNCFFNSLSYVITGNEHFQNVLRRAICSHLLHHISELKTYIPNKYDGNVEEYLNTSRMQVDGTWATEVEIFAATHMLKTPIFVYTQHGVHWTWLRHSPVQPETEQCIYLYHRGRNHYDVVLGIENRSEESKKQKLEKKSVSSKANYHTDPLKKKIKLGKQREKYRMDPTLSKTKKEKQKEKYDTDETYRSNIKDKLKLRYSEDSVYRDSVKSKRRLRYQGDPTYREVKKQRKRNKYLVDAIYCEAVKQKERWKYSSDSSYRNAKKAADKERYYKQEGYRIKKKAMSLSRYTTNASFRHALKCYSKVKYRKDTKLKKKLNNMSKAKYRNNDAFRTRVKDFSKGKYRKNDPFRMKVKGLSKTKYRNDESFRTKVKDLSKTKYRNDESFKKKVKDISKAKYRNDKSFRATLKASSIKKYVSNPLFRSRLKYMLQQQYRKNKEVRTKKRNAVQTRRKTLSKALQEFRKNINITPKYVCTACARLLCKTQVHVCNRQKYTKNETMKEMADKCLTGNYLRDCKEWISKTCHHHLSVGNMPSQALANNLTLVPIPEELHRLNSLEQQLVALRIPFMKVLSLPKGGQKGVKGQVVNVPSNLCSVTTSLPRTIDSAQMVKVKLKRKLSYKGHQQYELVNPSNVIEAVRYLVTNNKWYSGVSLNDEWYNENCDSDIVLTEDKKPECDDENDTTQPEDSSLNQDMNKNQHKSAVDDSNLPPLSTETCSQPLDVGQEYLDTNSKVFCVAPGENQIPQSIFQEKGADAMAFPVAHPDGNYGFTADREIRLSPSKYFNARLFCADNRFAKNNQFIFYAQFMVELYNIKDVLL